MRKFFLSKIFFIIAICNFGYGFTSKPLEELDSKRLKSNQTTTISILDLNSDIIISLAYYHLPQQDLLNLSETNKYFYQLLALNKNKLMMEKFNLSIDYLSPSIHFKDKIFSLIDKNCNSENFRSRIYKINNLPLCELSTVLSYPNLKGVSVSQFIVNEKDCKNLFPTSCLHYLNFLKKSNITELNISEIQMHIFEWTIFFKNLSEMKISKLILNSIMINENPLNPHSNAYEIRTNSENKLNFINAFCKLSDCKIIDLSIANFQMLKENFSTIISSFSNLQSLNISNCSIESNNCTELAKSLKNVTALDISFNTIKDEGFKSLIQNIDKNLESLNLQSTGLTKSCISIFENDKLSAIKYLNLQGIHFYNYGSGENENYLSFCKYFVKNVSLEKLTLESFNIEHLTKKRKKIDIFNEDSLAQHQLKELEIKELFIDTHENIFDYFLSRFKKFNNLKINGGTGRIFKKVYKNDLSLIHSLAMIGHSPGGYNFAKTTMPLMRNLTKFTLKAFITSEALINNFGSVIPQLIYLNISGNRLTIGTINEVISNAVRLKYLDIRCNDFNPKNLKVGVSTPSNIWQMLSPLKVRIHQIFFDNMDKDRDFIAYLNSR